MIEIHPQSEGNMIGMTVNGKLLKEDYETFIPKLEQMIADYGAIRCLIEITDMKGVELGAVWHEIKFDTTHCKDIEKCAVVGDPSWHHWMTKTGKLIFRRAEVEYFESENRDQAWEWLRQDNKISIKQTNQQEEQHAEPVGSCSSCGETN